MTSLRLSLIFLFAVGFICVANGNPISSLFGKSSEDKVEADDKTTVSTSSTAKSAGETTTTTTTTPESSSSCGGLKGFLHICNKNDPTEPPKNVKARSVHEEDDSDEDEDDCSKSAEDDDDSDEKTNNEKEKQVPTETSAVISESTEGGIAKRQVGDPEAPVLGEVPPVVADGMAIPEKPAEDKYREVEKRQADKSTSESDEDEQNSDENTESSRRRRDCRDREGDYEKDCRKKRELVPSCFGSDCELNDATEANE